MRYVLSVKVVILLLAVATTGFALDAPPEKGVAPTAAANAVSGEQSVLERFRSYTGPRTPTAMMSLFSPKGTPSFQQQPPIALSDGVTPLSVLIRINTQDGYAPNFSSFGAQFKSAKIDATGQWHIELLPTAGALHAGLVIMANGAVREVPLTIAPPLAAGTDLSAAAFKAFVNGGDAGLKPLRDLNGDKLLDYQDDYIFTANVLVKQRSDPHNPATRQQRARELTPKR